MVGFKLPAGAVTVFGYLMDQTAEPWGPRGGSIFGSINPDPHGDPEGFKRWRALHARRYGPAKEGDPSVISFPGFEHPQWQSWLEEIRRWNPGWFAEQGLGQAEDGLPTLQEIFDAQAWSGRDMIAAEGKRLFELDGAGVPVKPLETPAVTPPPPPVSASAGPPLSPLEVRVEELRSLLLLALDHMPSEVLPGLQGFIYFFTSQHEPGWVILGKKVAIEGLGLFRRLRHLLGDTRELPNR